MTLNKILSLVKQGFEVYPLSTNSKIPLSGTNGKNDATSDLQQVTDWFSNSNYNVGLRLDTSHILMVDVDLGHSSGVDGKSSLIKVFKEYGRLPGDTWIEKTPNGGAHYFFSYSGNLQLSNRISAFFKDSGIDIITTNAVIAPSMIDGKAYETLSGDYTTIKPVPNWLIHYLTTENRPFTPSSNAIRDKKYTGKLLDNMVAGCGPGERNNYLTKLAGSMLRVGSELETVYIMMLLINENFISQPLPDKEVKTIFESISKREERR